MAAYLLQRLLRALSTLLGTTFIIFLLIRVVPADPAVSIAGPKADPDTLAAIRNDLGLDDPVVVQFVRYVSQVASGDLGHSYLTGRRVSDVIVERLPATALLGLTSITIGFACGLLLGLLTAARQGSRADLVVLLIAVVGLALPTFWVGNLLVYAFGYRLRLLPLGGYGVDSHLRHLILPAATLALMQCFAYARYVHANVVGTLSSDYIRTARAKGLSTGRVYVRHALRNALIPIVTLLGLDMAALMSGVVLTETVFNWPGLGRLAVQAVFSLDVPVLAGTVLFSGALVLVCNLLVDLVYRIVDPRVQDG